MSYKFGAAVEKKFNWLVTRYPKKEATLIPLLHLVQKEVGHLSVEAIDYVAQRVGISPARVKEVASFYSLFRFEKKGKFVLNVCRTLSCFLKGSDELLLKLKEDLGVGPGETTADGLFSIETVECLASCGTAPVVQVNDWEYHENLDVEKIQKVVDLLKQNKACHSSFAKRNSEGAIA